MDSHIELLKSCVPKAERDDLELLCLDLIDMSAPYIGDKFKEMARRTGKAIGRGRKPMIYRTTKVEEQKIASRILACEGKVVVCDYYAEIISLGLESDRGFDIGDVRSTKELFFDLVRKHNGTEGKEFIRPFEAEIAGPIKSSQRELNIVNWVLTLAGFHIVRKSSPIRGGERVRAWVLRDEFQEYSLNQLINKYRFAMGKRVEL